MKLIVEPDAGVAPIISAIKQARKALDVLIFRLDRQEVITAFEAAVARGVAVRALIANTNRGGEKTLRKLELRLLQSGLTVTRTASDLVRYHGKMMIVDNRILHVYGFNMTGLDIEKSRSFGITTRNLRLVQESLKLFEADCARQPYSATYNRFVVSPENSREVLSAFIASAKKQLLIYDPKISDPAILRLLHERHKAGVDIRVIGKVAGKKSELLVEKYPGRRLHVRAIILDGRRAFMGSQSLRRLELDKRREVGVLIHDDIVVKNMQMVFEGDWEQTDSGRKAAKKAEKKEEKGEKKSGKESSRSMAAAS
jgi:cardiolipin synthase